MKSRFLFLASILLSVPVLSLEPDVYWPQWRGWDGQGVSNEKNLPWEWGPEKNVIWKVPVEGQGHSSPVVWGDRVFLTSDDGDTFVIAAGPEHRILATSSVGEPVSASPAISQGSFFIRGAEHLFRIGL